MWAVPARNRNTGAPVLRVPICQRIMGQIPLRMAVVDTSGWDGKFCEIPHPPEDAKATEKLDVCRN